MFVSKKKYDELAERVERLERAFELMKEDGGRIRVYEEWHQGCSYGIKRKFVEISVLEVLRKLITNAGLRLEYVPGTSADYKLSSVKKTKDAE